MHSATCEMFLESVAESQEGVANATASYVTEIVRVAHDPDATSKAELCEALTTLGYGASPRDDTDDTSGAGDLAETHPANENGGIEDLLGYRYAAGVIFGSFMLLPYILYLYPIYVTALFDPGEPPSLGSGGVLILPVFLVLTGVVLFFTGMPLLRGAYVSLKMRRPTTDLVVTITIVSAYLLGTVALLLGWVEAYYDLTIVVAAGVVAAIFYESLVKHRARDQLTDLTVSQVTEARRYHDDGTTATVGVQDLTAGDRVLVREGERIPVDGTLDEGSCVVDEAIVTGESLPVQKEAGDAVVGGSIVADDAALVRVKDHATSSINLLTTTVWDIQSATHGVQRRADSLAARIVPVVVGVALLAGGGTLATNGGIPAAVLAALTALIVACPWALGLSTPLSVATSIDAALKQGLVVFDETIFERLRDIDIVVFDKTGTLTTGEMEVIEADAPRGLLERVAELERRAAHPAANAIVQAFAEGSDGATATDGGVVDEPDGTPDRVSEFHSHSNGIEGVVDGERLLVGNLTLFEEHDWTVDETLRARAVDAKDVGRLPVVVGRDETAKGLVIIGDEPRDDWAKTVSELSDRDIDIVMLTGDTKEATDLFGRHDGIDHVFAGVPPSGKTAAVRRLQTENYVAMVGDGTNDAPALAAADLGIALGSGTALASDAADLAIVGTDLASVTTAFDLAAAAQKRLQQNTGLALVYNGLTIPAALTGLLNPVVAMLAAVISGGLIAVNSSRRLVEK